MRIDVKRRVVGIDVIRLLSTASAAPHSNSTDPHDVQGSIKDTVETLVATNQFF